MELRQIKYFIEVAKHEHVTKAANSMHIAQSAVSRQIFKLEEELGVDLFIREGRNVRLTPVGKIFLEQMEYAMQVIDNALQTMEEYMDPKLGTVHVGFVSTLATYILPTAISMFREKYPDVKFKLSQKSYYDLRKALIAGEINMAMIAPVPSNDKKVKGSILFSESMVALLPINHPLSNASTITLSQLREDSFILFPENFVLRDLIIDACKQSGFTPNASFEGEDIDAIKGLVSAGLGVSIVPQITVVDNLPRNTVRIPVVEPEVTRTVGVIIPADRQLLPTERLFYEFLQDFFMRLEKFQN